LGFAVTDPEVEEIIRKAVFSFEKLGCKVTEIKPDMIDMGNEFVTMITAETLEAVGKRYEEWKKVMYPAYALFMALGPSLDRRLRSRHL
jgi:Asp-tRNA(Asn)/Glu-tRNA(Gln) amidotransferase A subunit family amidase